MIVLAHLSWLEDLLNQNQGWREMPDGLNVWICWPYKVQVRQTLWWVVPWASWWVVSARHALLLHSVVWESSCSARRTFCWRGGSSRLSKYCPSLCAIITRLIYEAARPPAAGPGSGRLCSCGGPDCCSWVWHDGGTVYNSHCWKNEGFPETLTNTKIWWAEKVAFQTVKMRDSAALCWRYLTSFQRSWNGGQTWRFQKIEQNQKDVKTMKNMDAEWEWAHTVTTPTQETGNGFYRGHGDDKTLSSSSGYV